MRMDTTQKLTAHAVVNHYRVDTLQKIIAEYGADSAEPVRKYVKDMNNSIV
jgi:16S rRNA C1402 N4-methylase RsmH